MPIAIQSTERMSVQMAAQSPPLETTGALGDKKRVELHAGIIIRLILPFVALHCNGTVLLCYPVIPVCMIDLNSGF